MAASAVEELGAQNCGPRGTGVATSWRSVLLPTARESTEGAVTVIVAAKRDLE